MYKTKELPPNLHGRKTLQLSSVSHQSALRCTELAPSIDHWISLLLQSKPCMAPRTIHMLAISSEAPLQHRWTSGQSRDQKWQGVKVLLHWWSCSEPLSDIQFRAPLHWWLGVARVQRERAVSSKSGKQASCHSATGGVASCSRGLATPLGHTGRATLAVPPKHTCRCSARTEGERESRKGGRRAQDGDTH